MTLYNVKDISLKKQYDERLNCLMGQIKIAKLKKRYLFTHQLDYA